MEGPNTYNKLKQQYTLMVVKQDMELVLDLQFITKVNEYIFVRFW